MSEEDFEVLTAEIMQQGFDRDTAMEYAALIGDTPTLDAEGNVFVIGDDGQEVLAKLSPLKFFG